MITLQNKRVHDYIVQKDLAVNEGRKISAKIETLDAKISNYEEKEKKITSKVVAPKELTEKGDLMVQQIVKLNADIEKIIKEISDFKLLSVPKEIKEAHLALMAEREKLERDRNKIALKVQKIKDRIIPIIQREVKPLLNQYDDIETAKAKDGKVVITTFNHLEEWCKAFKNKSK